MCWKLWCCFLHTFLLFIFFLIWCRNLKARLSESPLRPCVVFALEYQREEVGYVSFSESSRAVRVQQSWRQVSASDAREAESCADVHHRKVKFLMPRHWSQQTSRTLSRRDKQDISINPCHVLVVASTRQALALHMAKIERVNAARLKALKEEVRKKPSNSQVWIQQKSKGSV